MKTIKLFLAVAGFCLSACHPEGFQVKGKVENAEGEKICLLISRDGQQDTLVQTRIKDGTFLLKGRVPEMTVASLLLNGRLPAIVFLENQAIFEVEYPPHQMPLVKGSGETQQLYNGFIDLEINYGRKEREQLSYGLIEASRNKDEKKLEEIRNQLNKIRQQAAEISKAYRWKYANTFFGLYELSVNVLQMDAVSAQKWFDQCDENLKSTALGKKVGEKIRTLEFLTVGARVPDFTAQTPEGNPISLYGLKAKVKLIDFWSSTCGQCKTENKLLLPFYQQYHPQGFEIISISLDTKHEHWVKAIQRDSLIWPQASDLKGTSPHSLGALYGVPMLPYTILVDVDNRVIARDIHFAQIKEKVPELLKQQAP